MHMSGSEKAEKIFQYLRYFIEETGSKIININVKVLDDSRNRIISQPMLKEQFLNKFINLYKYGEENLHHLWCEMNSPSIQKYFNFFQQNGKVFL